MSSLECNDHTGELRYLASQLFAKAHDFALLSEEEEGQELTKGHLDCDLGGAWGAKARTDACDLSSEFSAQALLLAVANAVDSALVSRKAVESNRGMTAFCVSEQMTRSLDRLKLSRSEFDICREGANGMDDGNLDRLFAWLSLRCMVEVRNDDACVNAIESDRLLSRLDLEPALTKKRKLHEVKLVETARLSGSDVANKGHHEIEQVGSNEADKPILAFEESTIAQLYGCSCRAELSGMPRTSRLLLLACARSIVNSGNGAIDLKGSTSHSLGEIHRRLIQLSPSVFGILEVFDEVNKVVAVKARPADYLGYKQSDIDWFTIEAYNKGINLTFLGDISNAEKLLGIALNLLPACGKEVECHASEMRLAYRFAIERKGDAGMIPNNGMLCVGYD